MNLPNETVKPRDARPAGKSGECFYCREPMGGAHKPSCVIVTRTVVVRLITDVVVAVPRDWNESAVNFQYQDSGYCMNNVAADLEAWLEARPNDCLCGVMHGEFVREATQGDHDGLPYLVSP